MDLNSIRADIQSFADDESSVAIDYNGDILFERNQESFSAKILIDSESGNLSVLFNDSKIPYKVFLKKIARLDFLAERIVSKRKPTVTDFVNGPALLKLPYDSSSGDMLNLIGNQCSDTIPFASKIVFVTADAGHGKTALLKEYQYQQAKRFLSGDSPFIFWHVDLQGRQLLRLSEALMGDLGELRISSLWMSSIITLIKHGLLVLAIDGFDELAAEIGSMDALGSLSSLVSNMDNKGILIAASRRTFFDTDDYLGRSKILKGKVGAQCQFNEIRLSDWGYSEAMQYISALDYDTLFFGSPNEFYHEILEKLEGNESHPILVRPFLFTKLVSGLLRYKVKPAEFMSGLQDPNKGLASIVRAFIEREVKDKWRVQDTGEPYLTFDQHMHLLSVIAEDMWHSQKDSISLDSIQFYTTILCDEWGISDDKLKTQVVDMVGMHALLTTSNNLNYNYRSFDHPEFKDYFISVSLARAIEKFALGGSASEVKKFLNHSPLPDAIANYVSLNINHKGFSTQSLLFALQNLSSNEWKPTYIQLNVGTLVPFIVDNYQEEDLLYFDSKVTFSSLAFENKVLNNICFINGSFAGASFIGSSMNNVRFEKCIFSDVSFDCNKTFSDVVIKDCIINSVKIWKDDDDIRQTFSPDSVRLALLSIGFDFEDEIIDSISVDDYETELRRILDKLLRVFRRTTSISIYHIENKFYRHQDAVNKILIPLMLRHGILEERPSNIRGYVLCYPLESILKSEGTEDMSQLSDFWREFNIINEKRSL